jgi:hypothetical protein
MIHWRLTGESYEDCSVVEDERELPMIKFRWCNPESGEWVNDALLSRIQGRFFRVLIWYLVKPCKFVNGRSDGKRTKSDQLVFKFLIVTYHFGLLQAALNASTAQFSVSWDNQMIDRLRLRVSGAFLALKNSCDETVEILMYTSWGCCAGRTRHL